jgi:hypothetical protein
MAFEAKRYKYKMFLYESLRFDTYKVYVIYVVIYITLLC